MVIAALNRSMKTLVGVMMNNAIITTKLMRKPYHMTHWARTNHRKLLIRIRAAKVEHTIVVIQIPNGVVNQMPRSRSCVLLIVSPKPVKRGANPSIAVNHPASACQ